MFHEASRVLLSSLFTLPMVGLLDFVVNLFLFLSLNSY